MPRSELRSAVHELCARDSGVCAGLAGAGTETSPCQHVMPLLPGGYGGEPPPGSVGGAISGGGGP
jgi:hypothetical protein